MKPDDLTDMQWRLLLTMKERHGKDGNYSIGAWDLAYHAGYRPSKNYRAAVAKTCRTLEARGFVDVRVSQPDQPQTTFVYYLTQKGHELVDANLSVDIPEELS